ncbi:hypothetical protein GFY24_27675 [Nocardia sp. SYP-A9097]|uniref:DUF7373 family lipoprotein n=1 Tax=Nocardia sp. SYP-A9097 TaxID=2663237 RepID=UPI00129AF8B8|nr:hypothetical protein [Nocardia sp. SYP-A9097]MRH91176.1 hypothetical protein [Nocardia sp. SYP-A9097]
MNRATRVITTVTCLALTATLAGCAQQGTAVAGEMDVRTLDAGTYPVNRYTYDRNSNGKGPMLEAMRMADAVTPTVKVDPSLKVGRGGIVLTEIADVVSVSHLSSSAKPVLQNRGFIAGFAISGSDLPDPAGSNAPDPAGTTVTIRLLRFPSSDNAKLAAKELEDADFNVALDQNKKLTLADYPDAFSHWRPGVGSIGVVMARKEFVISIFASRPKADQADLLSWAKKSLDAEVPAVDAFTPTPADKIDALPVDPDRLLARILVPDRENHTPDPDNFAVYGANMLIHPAGDEALRQRLVTDTGMDAMALTEDGYLFRTRDARGGIDLTAGLISSLGETAISAPDKVPDTKCVQHSGSYRCYVVYKRYVGVVTADSQDQVRKKATAEYVLLANSL